MMVAKEGGRGGGGGQTLKLWKKITEHSDKEIKK